MVESRSVDPQAAAKRAAGRAAAEEVRSGDRVGLGTGSTVAFTLERLAERVAEEGLELVGVPTSEQTEQRARDLGLPLADLNDLTSLNLTIDGADEIDPAGNLVKGGGGALTREKIVAWASQRLVIVVGEDKWVERLGSTFDLPIEVLEFGWKQTARHIEALGLQPRPRLLEDGRARRTDSGNLLLDARFGPQDSLRELHDALDCIPGVVENGLFLGRTGRVWLGAADGSHRSVDFG